MARFAGFDNAQEMGARIKLRDIVDPRTGEPVFSATLFESGTIPDFSVVFPGMTTVPVFMRDDQAELLVEDNKQFIQERINAHALDEVQQAAIAQVPHVQGLLMHYQRFDPVISFGDEFYGDIHHLTWYTHLQMDNSVDALYIQEIPMQSLLTKTVIYNVTLKQTFETSDPTQVLKKTSHMSTITLLYTTMKRVAAEFVQTNLKTDEGEWYVAVSPIPIRFGTPLSPESTEASFVVVFQWCPNKQVTEQLGEQNEAHKIPLRVLAKRLNEHSGGSNDAECLRHLVNHQKEATKVLSAAVDVVLGEVDEDFPLNYEQSSRRLDHDSFNNSSIQENQNTLDIFINCIEVSSQTNFIRLLYPSGKVLFGHTNTEKTLVPSLPRQPDAAGSANLTYTRVENQYNDAPLDQLYS